MKPPRRPETEILADSITIDINEEALLACYPDISRIDLLRSLARIKLAAYESFPIAIYVQTSFNYQNLDACSLEAIELWLAEHTQYASVPILDRRLYAFQDVQEAMLFKLTWG